MVAPLASVGRSASMNDLLDMALILILLVLAVSFARYRLTHPYTAEDVKTQRADARKGSEATLRGKSAEHLAAVLPDFQFNTRDARFIGDPIDYLVFDGLKDGDLQRIVVVEVKTGKQGLSPNERAVRKAIEEGRVEFLLLRLT